MSSPISKHGPSYYTFNQIQNIAETHFPDAYNAIPNVEDLPWGYQDTDTATFYEQILFIGYATIDGSLWKVSAYMLRSTGDIHLYRNEMRMSRADHACLQLGLPWVHLVKDGARPVMENLQVFLQYQFIAAGMVKALKVKNGQWYKNFELACMRIGVGMGMLKDPEARQIRDRVYQADLDEGMNDKKILRVLQKM